MSLKCFMIDVHVQVILCLAVFSAELEPAFLGQMGYTVPPGLCNTSATGALQGLPRHTRPI